VTGLVNVVQFPHPGREHNPGPSAVMPWNNGLHRRKFLISDGQWIGGPNNSGSGPVTFWGEWEPPSRVVQRWRSDGGLPTFLHEPLLTALPDKTELQNTDPLVFGSRFRYSNCKQFDRKNDKSSGLQDLEPGSVILFGSKEQGATEFVLDTVLVVAGGRSYSPSDSISLADEPFVRRVVVEPLSTFEEALRWRFTLFDGATPDDPTQGMFSFVPCMPVEREPLRFARPRIRLAGLINPRSQQAPKGYTRHDRLDIGGARSAWQSVVEQVLDAGCVLGYDFPEPVLTDGQVG
jgi:hypothetical protein